MNLFLVEQPLAAHVLALRPAEKRERSRYIVSLLWNLSHSVPMTPATKIRVLAALWGLRERALAAALLDHKSEEFGMPAVLGALKLLDSQRKTKQLGARLHKFRDRNTAKARAVQVQLDMLQPSLQEAAEAQASAKGTLSGVSGALQRHVARWVRSLPKDKLEFWMLVSSGGLGLPKESWLELAQITHLSPTKDFSRVPWFLGHAFGTTEPPARSMCAEAQHVTAASVTRIATEFSLPYSFVRRRFENEGIPNSAKVAMARYMPLEQLVWYYDDGADPLATEDGAVERILDERLASGERPAGLSAGKLLERLLAFLKIGVVTDEDTLAELFPGIGAGILSAALRRYNGDVSLTAMQLFELSSSQIESRFMPAVGAPAAALSAIPAAPAFVARLMPHAAAAMAQLSVPLERETMIIGDASASMQVAVSVSSILAGLIAAVSDAGLCFFNTERIAPPVVPRTVPEILEVARAVKADGATCPAAALWPLYEARQRMRRLVIVSDEEENTQYRGHSFLSLFTAYEKEVAPGCQLTFVSFLADMNSEGQMVGELRAAGFTPEQFRLHRGRPDLTKTDALLAVMSAKTAVVEAERAELERVYTEHGLGELLGRLKLGLNPEEAEPPVQAAVVSAVKAAVVIAPPSVEATVFLQECGVMGTRTAVALPSDEATLFVVPATSVVEPPVRDGEQQNTGVGVGVVQSIAAGGATLITAVAVDEPRPVPSPAPAPIVSQVGLVDPTHGHTVYTDERVVEVPSPAPAPWEGPVLQQPPQSQTPMLCEQCQSNIRNECSFGPELMGKLDESVGKWYCFDCWAVWDSEGAQGDEGCTSLPISIQGGSASARENLSAFGPFDF